MSNANTPPVIATTIPYNAGDFTSSSGSWGVDSSDIFAWQWINLGNKAHIIILQINSSTVVGTPTALQALLPGGIVGLRFTQAIGYGNANGAASEIIIGSIDTLSNLLTITRLSGANWVAGADLTSVRVIIPFVSQ